MTQELSFALQAAFTGIGIVFGFLLLLSLLMVAIRGLVDGLFAGKGSSAARRPATATTSAAAPPPAGRWALPAWVVAAAAAYLESEAKDGESSARASVWVNRGVR